MQSSERGGEYRIVLRLSLQERKRLRQTGRKEERECVCTADGKASPQATQTRSAYLLSAIHLSSESVSISMTHFHSIHTSFPHLQSPLNPDRLILNFRSSPQMPQNNAKGIYSNPLDPIHAQKKPASPQFAPFGGCCCPCCSADAFAARSAAILSAVSRAALITCCSSGPRAEVRLL